MVYFREEAGHFAMTVGSVARDGRCSRGGGTVESQWIADKGLPTPLG